jgi:hypothetical protein
MKISTYKETNMSNQQITQRPNPVWRQPEFDDHDPFADDGGAPPIVADPCAAVHRKDQRSAAGEGELCGLYMVSAHEQFCGKGEDFANTMWPVVVKAKPDVSPPHLAQMLRDLADKIEGGFYVVMGGNEKPPGVELQ